jgi:hypothetical protein
VIAWLVKLPWLVVIAAVLTLGLAPFNPPHVWEKLVLLSRGQLTRPVDWFDFLLHGSVWLVLVAKVVAHLLQKPDSVA